LNDLAAQLAHVRRLLQQSDGPAALQHSRDLLQDHPDNPEVLRCVALSLIKQRSYLEAIRILTRALELEPRNPDALYNLAGVFAQLRQPEEAQVYLDRLLRVAPLSSQVNADAASNALAMNQVELAIRLGRTAVSLAPENAAARLTLGDALEAGGQFEEAKSQYLAILERDSQNVSALANLLRLRHGQVPERHEQEAQRLLASNALSDAQRAQLHYGLAQYYDSRQQYDPAFTHISAANATRHGWYPFDSDKFSSVVDELIRAFSAQKLGSLAVPGVRTAKALFIVGMPRSGTTLVEQILGSHSQIAAGGELPTITNIATEIAKSPEGYPSGIFALDPTALGHYVQQYLDKLTSISAHALRVTDKMPFNFLHLGLVAALFPDARIIHCRRDPLDTCTSCHFTTFNQHLQFASDLRTLGRYFLDYRRLMEHWKAVLATPMLEVDYESLVTDTEPVIRRLVEFCGVDWEPGCAQFYQTERGISTPSRWQVRQPIYRHAVGRWRNYEKHLAPLMDVLSPALASSAREPMDRA
jgi:tetratricopeptide (TPR) repeat protein